MELGWLVESVGRTNNGWEIGAFGRKGMLVPEMTWMVTGDVALDIMAGWSSGMTISILPRIACWVVGWVVKRPRMELRHWCHLVREVVTWWGEQYGI